MPKASYFATSAVAYCPHTNPSAKNGNSATNTVLLFIPAIKKQAYAPKSASNEMKNTFAPPICISARAMCSNPSLTDLTSDMHPTIKPIKKMISEQIMTFLLREKKSLSAEIIVRARSDNRIRKSIHFKTPL